MPHIKLMLKHAIEMFFKTFQAGTKIFCSVVYTYAE